MCLFMVFFALAIEALDEPGCANGSDAVSSRRSSSVDSLARALSDLNRGLRTSRFNDPFKGAKPEVCLCPGLLDVELTVDIEVVGLRRRRFWGKPCWLCDVIAGKFPFDFP
jgi:hypothetical protein